MRFYTVTAHFDMAQYSDIRVESFRKLENANIFAKEMKEQFLQEISEGKLDTEQSDQEYGRCFYFYGVSENGENFCKVYTEEVTFNDEKELTQ